MPDTLTKTALQQLHPDALRALLQKLECAIAGLEPGSDEHRQAVSNLALLKAEIARRVSPPAGPLL